MPPRVFRSDGLERPDHGPAAAEALADDPVDVLDADDAVAHEAVRLAQQRALQPVEDEPLDLARQPHDAHARRPRASPAARSTTSGRVNGAGTSSTTGSRYGGLPGARRGSARGPASSPANAEAGERRGARGEHRSGGAARVEPGEELALQLEALGRALLDVGRRRRPPPRRRRRPRTRAAIAAGGLVEQLEPRELLEPRPELERRQLEPAAVRVLEHHPRPAPGEHDRPARRRCCRRRRSRSLAAGHGASLTSDLSLLSRKAPVVVVSFARPRALPPAWPFRSSRVASSARLFDFCAGTDVETP